MTDTSLNRGVLPEPEDGKVPTGQPSDPPETAPNRAVDSVICGVVATLLTTVVLADAYYTSIDTTYFSDPPSFRRVLAANFELQGWNFPILAILAVGVVLSVLAVVLSTRSRRRAGRSRKASAGRWLGVVNMVAYGAIAAMLPLQSVETWIFVHTGGEPKAFSASDVLAVVDSISVVDPLSADKSLSVIDARLALDLNKMAVRQDMYVNDHPDTNGAVVTATKPGGTASLTKDDYTLHLSPGNVIAVKVGPSGYCVSGYNKDATKATSPTASMLFRSGLSGGGRGLEPVGTC